MFDSFEFKAMQSSIETLWLKQKVISQNIANYETPGYKAQSVRFEDVLKGTQEKNGSGGYHFQAVVTTQEDTAIRPDGNNVDIEKENLELYQTYLQSAYLYEKIRGQFTNMRYVLNQAMK